MTLDLQNFFQATNPDKPLFVDKSQEDQNYYIDFSSVRGGQIIKELKDLIAILSPDQPTCQLFTGHVGCGKSTELVQLKAELEQQGFHVVYFESNQNLEMADVDVSDILLAIAARVSESLDRFQRDQTTTTQDILKKVATLLQTEIELSAEASIPGVGDVTASTEGDFSVNLGIPGIGEIQVGKKEGFSLVAPLLGKITARAKASPEFRNKLRGYLEARTNGIIEAINTELLEPGIEQLKKCGKTGLVVIVDNLDRVDSTAKPWGRSQQAYLFVDRGEQLRGLNCHLIYTLPLGLRFSNEFGALLQRFNHPKVLPMVQVQLRDGSECEQGMKLLRQMVLARAFPDLDQEQRLSKISEIFDPPETLDHLCRISGGHVRNLLRLLNNSLQKEMGLPISRNSLEEVIQEVRNGRKLAVTDDEWDLLRRVGQEKKTAGDDGYETLIRSMFVYEYCDKEGSWFAINPILADAEELKQ